MMLIRSSFAVPGPWGIMGAPTGEKAVNIDPGSRQVRTACACICSWNCASSSPRAGHLWGSASANIALPNNEHPNPTSGPFERSM